LTLREGSDAAILTMGGMAALALESAAVLSAEGIEVRVVSMVSIKPLDEDAVVAAARQTGAIVTAEDHNRYGGLGSAVAETLVRCAPVPMEQVAVPDMFAESGPNRVLYEKYHLTPADITLAVRRVIDRREQFRMER
jgi:transketolase